MAEFLFIVARDNHRLYSYLMQKFAGEKGHRIVQERRGKGERRQPRAGVQMPERRRGDRRRLRVNENDLRSYGFVVIRQQ